MKDKPEKNQIQTALYYETVRLSLHVTEVISLVNSICRIACISIDSIKIDNAWAPSRLLGCEALSD